MTDERVVYGATCSWWGLIGETGRTASGLPACPKCGGVLFEVGSEAEWWDGVNRHAADVDPGYRDFIEWLRGRCFRSADGILALEVARAAWEASVL